MSGMVQDFLFETDDKKQIEKVLSTMLPIFFQHSESDCVQYQIRTSSSYWPDGAYENPHVAGPFIYEDKQQKKVLVLDHCATFGGAGVLKELTQAKTKDEAAKYASQQNEEKNPREPKRILVAVLQDYKEPKPDFVCVDLGAMKDTTMELIEKVNPSKLLKEVGDGFNSSFGQYDGSISHGWRLQYQPLSGWNKLVVSMTHIYYGK